MARNRVIYQSEALYVTSQYTGFKTLDIVNGTHTGVGNQEGAGGFADHGEIASGSIHQIHRVQSANYNFAINRTDVNQFGNLARIDTAVIDAPTVGLDFTYLVTNGLNEDKLGVSSQPQSKSAPSISAISGILSNVSGRNYHILTVTEGRDANDSSLQSTNTSTVISIGNGYITNYSVSASVGSIPTASVSVEGLNISAQTAGTGMQTPAINPSDGTQGSAKFTLPAPITGPKTDVSKRNTVGEILRPGDIEINLTDGGATGLLANMADTDTDTSAHIQSFSIDLPLGRSVLQRLGNSFGFAREVDFPVQVSCSFSAIVADLKAGNLFNELYDNTKSDIEIVMKAPAAGGAAAGSPQLRYILKNCTLESESFSSSIGDNKSVDLTFSATVGGPDDSVNGLFISGAELPNEFRSAN
tara:strand:+ start:685 stop:1929 length:1245 start_codon:yes stop_codon:yes gene_type:complete